MEDIIMYGDIEVIREDEIFEIPKNLEPLALVFQKAIELYKKERDTDIPFNIQPIIEYADDMLDEEMLPVLYDSLFLIAAKIIAVDRDNCKFCTHKDVCFYPLET